MFLLGNVYALEMILEFSQDFNKDKRFEKKEAATGSAL